MLNFKKLICLLIIALVSVSFAFSSKVSYRFKYVGEEEIDCFEYRFNDGTWKTLDKDQNKMVFEMSDIDARALKEDSFQIRSKKDDRVSVDVNGIPVRHNHVLNASVLPYGLEIITQQKTNKSKTVNSRYGMGAELSYQYFMFNNLYTTVGAQWNMLLNLKGQLSINSIIGFGGFGYSFDLSDIFKAFTEINVGGDTLLSEGAFSEVVAYMLNAGLEYQITDKLSAKLACRGLFEYAQLSGNTYFAYRILPSIGMTVKGR